MNKILVTFYVPTIDEEYNLFIPINLKLSDALELIQQAIFDLSGEYYVINPNAVLIDSLEGKIINSNNVVKFSGLRNGSKVMLI